MKDIKTSLSIVFFTICGNACSSTNGVESGEINIGFGMQVVMTTQPGEGGELSDVMLKASKLVSSMEGCAVNLLTYTKTLNCFTCKASVFMS